MHIKSLRYIHRYIVGIDYIMRINNAIYFSVVILIVHLLVNDNVLLFLYSTLFK